MDISFAFESEEASVPMEPLVTLHANDHMSFDGVIFYEKYGDTPAVDLRRTMTLGARIYVNSFGDWEGLIAKGESQSPWALQLGPNGLLRFTTNWDRPVNSVGGGTWNSATAMVPFTWHDAAVSYDGKRVHFYINGELVSNQPLATIVFGQNSKPLFLGVDLAGGDQLHSFDLEFFGIAFLLFLIRHFSLRCKGYPSLKHSRRPII